MWVPCFSSASCHRRASQGCPLSSVSVRWDDTPAWLCASPSAFKPPRFGPRSAPPGNPSRCLSPALLDWNSTVHLSHWGFFALLNFGLIFAQLQHPDNQCFMLSVFSLHVTDMWPQTSAVKRLLGSQQTWRQRWSGSASMHTVNGWILVLWQI